MKSEIIRVGVIGAGANTKLHHIPKLQAQPGVEVVGVVNRSRASSEAVASAFGIPRVYVHWREAVEDPATQAIVIGTWPYLHAPITLAALAAGKHVLTEARMARDAQEAHAMWAAAQQRPDLVTQVVPAPMSLEVDRTMQRLWAEGWLGELRFIESMRTVDFPAATPPLHWRRDYDLSGLNVGAMGIVYEMIMRWVGPASRVLAMSRTFDRRNKVADGQVCTVQVPDHLDVLADMACGAQLHLQQSQSTVLKEGAGIWLYGTEGVLRFHDKALTGARRGEKELQPIPIPEDERGGWRVEESFINAIRGREPVTLTNFADGVKYMEFIEAVARSAAQGRAIHLPLRLNGG